MRGNIPRAFLYNHFAIFTVDFCPFLLNILL